MTHNPAVIQFGGKYWLFYIGLNYEEPLPALTEGFGAFRTIYRRIRIGVAWSERVEGPYTRLDRPVIDTDVAPWAHLVTTNPSPVVTPQGRVRVYYRTPRDEGGWVKNVLTVAEADHPAGPYRALLNEPMLPAGCHLEDPHVWWNGEEYEALAKDLDGTVAGQVAAGVHLVSHDGLAWRVGDPALAYRRELRFADGNVMEVGNLERPWVLMGMDGQPEVLYAAASDHPEGFVKASRTWLQAVSLIK
jgi:hypothetical protein